LVKLFCLTICGQENDPNNLRKIASIAGGPAQFATIAFATCKKKTQEVASTKSVIVYSINMFSKLTQ